MHLSANSGVGTGVVLFLLVTFFDLEGDLFYNVILCSIVLTSIAPEAYRSGRKKLALFIFASQVDTPISCTSHIFWGIKSLLKSWSNDEGPGTVEA
mmetsp:Transcript_33989/g.64701  ORF Transcript_33989/g.64701 Transcript_33989/m.64701 type:complete len:96 (+) Transcript_33989:277-564(+)